MVLLNNNTYMKRDSFRKELIRKLIHLTAYTHLIIFIVISEVLDARKLAFLILTLILLFFLELEYLRVERPSAAFPSKFSIFREKEQATFAGHIYILLGAIIAFAAFDIRVASAAYSMAILGDVASALIGKKWGRHAFIFSNKTWEGTIAGFLFNIMAGYFFLIGIPNRWTVLFLMAAVASLVEVFTQKLDDNLTVPIFAGMAGQVALLLLV